MINNPITQGATKTVVNIAQTVPSAIFWTTEDVFDYSTKTIDQVASFGMQNILQSDKQIHITSKINSRGQSILNNTSKLVPINCSVIYTGKVKHPIKKKDTK
jgi:hypothetical protein